MGCTLKEHDTLLPLSKHPPSSVLVTQYPQTDVTYRRASQGSVLEAVAEVAPVAMNSLLHLPSVCLSVCLYTGLSQHSYTGLP